MQNKTYDRLKFVALILLPASATFYFAIAQIWHLPYATEVVGTIAAVDTFMGALLGISTKKYHNSDASYDGRVVIDSTNPDKDVFSLELNGDPMDLANQNNIKLRVDSDV